MDVAAVNIGIAVEAFSQRTEISLAHYNERLNKIMLALTLTTICLLPPQIIGSIMGMNIHVPFQENKETLFPFYMIVTLMTVLILLIILTLSYLKVHKVIGAQSW